jgi:hypothetical protein
VKDFESMTDDEFAAYLCTPVRLMDEMMRGTGLELVPDYRQRLVDADRYCMEPVPATV